MNPQEDPEARIRDLERSLSDVAGRSELQASSSELGTSNSELGTGQYGGGYGTPPGLQPPPPPPGYSPTAAYPPPPGYSAAPYTAPYSNQYPTTPPRSTGGFSWWWLVVATFVVGGVAVGAGVAVFGTHLFSNGTSITSSPRDRPSISGGGGILTNMPTPPDFSGGITQEPEVVAPIAPGSVVTIGGMGANKTIDCNEGTVNISGVENTIVITGHCVSVNVSGIENVVTVDSAEAIVASGFDNRITFKTGSPEISNSGGDNVVEQG
jgi:DUF3060 family protein